MGICWFNCFMPYITAKFPSRAVIVIESLICVGRKPVGWLVLKLVIYFQNHKNRVCEGLAFGTEVGLPKSGIPNGTATRGLNQQPSDSHVNTLSITPWISSRII